MSLPSALLARRFGLLLGFALIHAVALHTVAAAQSPLQHTLRTAQPVDKGEVTLTSDLTRSAPAWMRKLDPALRPVAFAEAARQATGRYPASWRPGLFTAALAAKVGPDGRLTLDLLVQTDAPAALAALADVEVRTVVGDIAVVRASAAALEPLATRSTVRFVEAARLRPRLNDAGRADIRADAVHQGEGGLPQAYRGAGVTVGVVDSGIDFTHPDFSNAGGTRLRHLLEFTEGGGQNEWTKAQIDANPGAVTQRDGDGGFGHGTHVMGTAAGSGGFNVSHTGIAPEADLVFVKGIRSPTSTGGFSDADVIAGVDYIFQRAGSQPAVANLSLGSNFGSLDGTSLYEQALSDLTGEGRIIVAAAGNEGFSFIHAGGQAQPNTFNETLVLTDNPERAIVNMWYEAGSLNEFYIGAYAVDANGNLDYLGEAGVAAGQILADNSGQPVPLVVDGFTLGFVLIDAQTTQDPRNGDGNALFGIFGDPQNGVDISQVVWTVFTRGSTGGRIDLWATGGGEFVSRTFGFPDSNELPGNTDMTIGAPSSARDVIAVGSYVTKNAWTDVDGRNLQWQNPNPDHNPQSPPVLPAIGQMSYFSSQGPTRDGRTSPDLAAPGELIFSALSSHLTEGVGIQRGLILEGGGYGGQQGTSMASPHVTGTIALMLEANPTLTPAEALDILQTTARTDSFTGGVPNNRAGAGKIDALGAVLETLRRGGGGGGGGSTRAETEPNNSIDTAQRIAGAPPITVTGQAEHSDVGDLVYSGYPDDIEDLYRIVTTEAGLALTLSNYTEDLDLFLIAETPDGLVVEALSNSVEATETIDEPTLPAGTYYVGVSFYDATGETGSTDYTLVMEGRFPVDRESDAATAEPLALHPNYPNPVTGTTMLAYDLPEPMPVRLTVYDVLGREVARLVDAPRVAGTHSVRFDAHSLGAGVYLYRLEAGGATRTRSFVVVR